jgi:hypothetical protein
LAADRFAENYCPLIHPQDARYECVMIILILRKTSSSSNHS